MKKRWIFIFIGLLFLSFCAKEKPFERFSYSPKKPIQGEEISVSYDPTGTLLADVLEMDMDVYSYTKGLPEAQGIPLTKKGKLWIGSFTTDKKSRGLIVRLKSENIVDNNNSKGYLILLFDKNKRQVAGSLAGFAEAIVSWGYYLLELVRNEELALKAFEEEFALHPEMKKEYLGSYLPVMLRFNLEGGRELLIKELEKISVQKDLSVEDLSLLARLYQMLYMFEKAEVFAEKIREKDPRGEFVQDERYQKISGTADIKEKIKLFEKFKNDFPKSSMNPMIQYEITQYYKATGDFEALVDYTEKNLEGMDWSVLHSIAWDIAEVESDIGRAEEFGRAAVERARKELEYPEEEKPSYVTEKDWKKQRAYILGEVLDTYGYVLFKLDKHKEAKAVYEEAIKLNQGKNSEMNERYAQILVEVEDPGKALSEIGGFIETGKSTYKMKELLKDVYVQKNGSEQGFDLYLKELELVPRKKLMARLEKKMINIPALKFSLNDLEGNTVSLSDLKGKVVVLDFWATWCGYCKQSFPAMKKAVEKYKDDESVKFLFVNSLERVENRKEIASMFISQNNYPFQVLLDLEDKIVMAYGAEALPTKIIIDGKGRIRFKTVGFSGDSEKMLEELITKIEMVR